MYDINVHIFTGVLKMNKSNKNSVILLYLALLVFWIVLASRIGLAELIVGAVAVLLVVAYSLDLVFTKHEATKLTLKTLIRFFVLLVTLIKEMIIANLHVAKIVLSPSLPVDPGFVKIKQPLKKELNQALFGNAITLTPGTLTVDLNKDEIVIHALKVEYAHAIENGPIQKAFIRLEGEES